MYLIIGSCYPFDVGIRTQSVDSEYIDTIQHVVNQWSFDNSLPPYNCDLGELFLATPVDEIQFSNASNGSYCWPGSTCGFNAAGFLLREDNIRDDVTYIIVIAANLEENEIDALVAHETIHWLSFCTGHSQVGTITVNGDAAHKDERLWGPTGVLVRSGY